ncbi:MAG: hypothetical protein DHS20C15_09570 [Planctomycetota bacterium]|nr:MAG: hypothetical protein DHS20C15_09570 [Planctomycetota bacterium]
MRLRALITAGLLAASMAACASAPKGARLSADFAGSTTPPPLNVAWQDDEAAEADEGHGFVVGALLYIPSRIFDVFDIVRARVRVGPGIAIGARATELADVFVGTYATIYVGLPGPRGRVTPRLPFGLESKSGAEVSVADVTLEAGLGPDYGEFEFGAGLQLLIVGVDIGVDPWEILDLVTGLLTIDIADDDF